MFILNYICCEYNATNKIFLIVAIFRMYQQRLPNELLSNLANSLLDKTVFDIVKGLKDIQEMTENNLLDSRMKFISNQRGIFFKWCFIFIKIIFY